MSDVKDKRSRARVIDRLWEGLEADEELSAKDRLDYMKELSKLEGFADGGGVDLVVEVTDVRGIEVRDWFERRGGK